MYRFVNPYSFVPFGKDSPEKKDKNEVYRGEVQKDLLTGWLNIKLSIRTPLIIPDGAHPTKIKLGEKGKEYVHLKYDFFKMYNSETDKKEYVIPGSELRGLIRSTYEAATNSCLPFLLNDKPMSQRVPLYAALNRRGLLGYSEGKWVLYGADKTLEEVIVVPVYEAYGNYYAESIKRIRDNKDNNKPGTDGKCKYSIMGNLDLIEDELKEGIKYKEKQILYNARIVKKGNRDWSVEVDGVEKAKNLSSNPKSNPVDYLFIREDGSYITDLPGDEVPDKGWIQYNVPVDTDRVYHVAYLKKAQVLHEWDESSPRGEENDKVKDDRTYAEAYKQLKAALHRDGTSLNNVNKKCNNALKDALEAACDVERNPEQLVPIYFFPVYEKTVIDGEEKIKELVYMSGAAAGRIGQRRKWIDIMSGHTPCGDKLCPACRLFGTTEDGGMKGHVRFTDAFMKNLIEGSEPETTEHTLRILSTPRTTAFEFYLKKPVENATYWNFDFYGVTESDENNDRSHTSYHHLEKATPRGRKMYWHHDIAPDADSKQKMNNTMESIDKGDFGFRIYFDQISREQLTDLIWTINLGENDERGNYLHKLGHAKPLGYGSVKLIVEGGTVRRFTRDEKGTFALSTRSLEKEGIDIGNIIPSFDLASEEVSTLLNICRFDAVGSNTVDYPRRYPGGKIFEWFADNRTNSKYLKVLPEPKAEDISLTGGTSRTGNNSKGGTKQRSSNHPQMTVELTRLKNDNKNPGMKLGFTEDGMVFEIPPHVTSSKIRVIMTKAEDGKKYYKYIDEV